MDQRRLPPGAMPPIKLPKNPDRYPNMDFEPVDYAEYPKAVYVESDMAGHSHVDGLDHVRHKQPVIVHSAEEEADVKKQDDEHKAREAERKSKEEDKSSNKLKG